MNKVLQIKGTFNSQKHPPVVVMSALPVGSEVDSIHMRHLLAQLIEVKRKWETDPLIGSCLVMVHYNRIIPKSRRISTLIKDKGLKADECIVGARFEDVNEDSSYSFNKRHVFTYNVSYDALDVSIGLLERCIKIVDDKYDGKITYVDIKSINEKKELVGDIAKSVFTGIIVDCYVIHHIGVDENRDEITESTLVSLFKTKIPTQELLRRIGINISDSRMLDDNTVRLFSDEIKILKTTAPYLISMLSDFSEYDAIPSREEYTEADVIGIPNPTDEPYIGVIDTHFDERVYFHKWVDYCNVMDKNIPIESEDYFHGTSVSSIIVDGPQIDSALDDGCGRFRVRHFGVAKEKGASSFEILKKIREIVSSNADIKVWNLSLGSMLETSENSISAEASILDKLQNENDVIFVVAGTNDSQRTGKKRVGAPADSINSIVVNAVSSFGECASYSRKGPVLGFFYKPDVSFFGGDKNDFMRVCGPLGEAKVTGTSYAAPWVTRKVAFLIYKMGLSREVAKALLIDSAAGWDRKDNINDKIGYGVVPIKIRDILVVTGTVKEYETFNYTIPVPTFNNMFPYWTRATLAYFPACNRNQGVDYTSTEIDLHFGRVYSNKGKVQIKEMNDNKQTHEGATGIFEKDARLIYRKWDNIKHISEAIKSIPRPKKMYGAGMWGLKIVTKERGYQKAGRGMQFGVVVTLREMNGVNRIDEFVKLCALHGWLVNQIDIDTHLDLYNKANVEINWD